MEKIHVAYGLFDPTGTYSKYVGVSIASMFSNTKSNVIVHILTDKFFSSKNKRNFEKLAEKYRQDICFHNVEIKEQFENVKGLKRVTEGTLYRLKLPEILNCIKKVIYLDADTFVNMDINDLWNEDLDGRAVLAVKDINAKRAVAGELEKQGILASDMYYNAGVMVWNLEKIRSKYDIYSQAVNFFLQYGDYCNGFTDQHATNAIFKGDVGFLPQKYNVFTNINRKSSNDEYNAIYHFASERPRMDMLSVIDRMFFEQLCDTPWGDSSVEIADFFACGIRERDKSIGIYRNVLNKRLTREIVIWGAGSVFCNKVIEILGGEEHVKYCVDKDEKITGMKLRTNLKVYSPNRLKKEKRESLFIVVTSKYHYKEISNELMNMGYVEEVDFVNGMMLLTEDEGYIYVK